MKKLLFILLLALPIANANAEEASKFAPPVIAIVDIQKIMRDSNASKAARDQLSAKRAEYQKEITEAEKKLRTEAQAHLKQRKEMGDEKFKAGGAELDKQGAALQEKIRSRTATLDAALEGTMKQIRDAAAKIVAEEASARGANIVLDRAQTVVVDVKLDMTDIVMAKLNSTLPKVDVKFTEKK